MNDAGIFDLDNELCLSTTESILHHWDLEPRNILIQPKSSLSEDHTGDGNNNLQWEIDKVIDWDGVHAVPAVLARKPPTWLWESPSRDSDDWPILSAFHGDTDILPPSRYDKTAFTQADRQIKEHFEEKFVEQLTEIYPNFTKETYLEEAYGNGRWIRLLNHFAKRGVKGSKGVKRFEHLDSEWRQSQMQRGVQSWVLSQSHQL